MQKCPLSRKCAHRLLERAEGSRGLRISNSGPSTHSHGSGVFEAVYQLCIKVATCASGLYSKFKLRLCSQNLIMAQDLDVGLVSSHPYLTVAGLALVYLVSLGIYRLHLHPLSHIPGPRFAIITQWYEFYYDVILHGQFQNQFLRWHEKYGPVIRINPNELHCIDPAFIDTIYAGGGSGKKRDKNLFYLNAFQLWHSCFGAAAHDIHRQRRSSMNPFFSKASVTKLEGTIRGYIDRVCAHIESYAETEDVCNLSLAFMCLSTDVITSFTFGWDRGYTKNRSFEPNLMQAMRGGLESTHMMRHFPFLLPMVENHLPESFVAKLLPGGDEYFRFQRLCFQTADDAREGRVELISKEGQKTIFKDILEGDYPEEEKSKQRLRESAREVIGAGVLTTASGTKICTAINMLLLTNS